MFRTVNDKANKNLGTAFIELQYCKISKDKCLEDIVGTAEIEFWKEDSLYVYERDICDFMASYFTIFGYGTYQSLAVGDIDPYEMTYFMPSQVEKIKRLAAKEKPKDFETIVSWLEKASEYNGIYVLGIK